MIQQLSDLALSWAESCGIQGFDFAISLDWGAHAPDYRAKIRDAASTVIKEDLRDLSRRPFSNQFSISISHCPSVGAFAICKRPATIGIDFEDESRIKEAAVARVSTAQELAETPSPALLWCAKEAAYKALPSGTQPPTISQILVTDWAKEERPSAQWPGNLSIWSYRILDKSGRSIAGKGLASHVQELAGAFFYHSPQT
jgi:hypothetical protein